MKNNIPKKTLRQFGFLIFFTFTFLIGWFLPLLGGHPFRVWTLFISMPAGILGILRPGLLLYPYIAWMKLGLILGWVNSRIILGLVFLIVLQPISIIMKSLGYDPLKKINKDLSSYKENRDSSIINLKRIF